MTTKKITKFDHYKEGTYARKLAEGLDGYLQSIVCARGVDAEHVARTPDRYISALQELFEGVSQKPEDALNTLFTNEDESEMIHEKEISFFSMCSHHLLPFFGKMSFAYIPDQHIVGISKIPRLVEVYARRPQVQEKLTNQIVKAFQDIVKPHGCALQVRAYHLCCASRGIKQPTAYTETTALRGVFKNGETKAEFLASVNNTPFKIF